MFEYFSNKHFFQYLDFMHPPDFQIVVSRVKHLFEKSCAA